MTRRKHPAPSRAMIGAAALAMAALSSPANAADTEGPVARGRYLVFAGACADCHTPWKPGPDGPAPDPSRWLSGHPEGLALPPPPAMSEGPWLVSIAASNTAWSGPWGVSFTANLTPDPDTGLGRWTARNFVDAIRNGRHMGRGRPILPPMPYPMYREMSDDDLEAIFAYLQSIPAIRNQVPEPLPPAIQTTRAGP